MSKYSSNNNFYKNKSVDRRFLWRSVNKTLNYKIHSAHVLAIINLLFDEIIKELLAGNEIKIGNFGILKLKNTKPRKYHNVVNSKIMESKGGKVLRFIISSKLSKFLIKNLDLNKTF